MDKNSERFLYNKIRVEYTTTGNAKHLIVVLLVSLITTHAIAQDSLATFREFAKLYQVYGRRPFQFRVDIRNSAIPFTTAQDTLEASMNIYVGMRDMYLETEGQEQIVNDSLVIIVNNPAKQIILYPNNEDSMEKILGSVSMVLPDSSLKAMAEKYTSLAQDVDGNARKIMLSSRETLYGTKQPKEIITTTFQKSTFQPIEIVQTKLKSVLIDSTSYASLINDKMYNGKLIRTLTSKGNVFFLVKELKTTYRFKKIEYDVANPPARVQDRVVKTEDGGYTPAKGYEDYLLSKEF